MTKALLYALKLNQLCEAFPQPLDFEERYYEIEKQIHGENPKSQAPDRMIFADGSVLVGDSSVKHWRAA
jgi:hypothetical protein